MQMWIGDASVGWGGECGVEGGDVCGVGWVCFEVFPTGVELGGRG